MTKKITVEELKNVSMFKDSSSKVLEQLCKIISRQDYLDGNEIFAEGSFGDSLYIVISGEILIRKKFETQDDTFKELAYIGPGEFFGELSLIDKLKRSAQAVSRGNTSVYCINRDDFQKLLLSSPEVAVEQLLTFLRTISQRLRLSNSHLITIYEIGLLISREKSTDGISNHILRHVRIIVGDEVAGFVALWNQYNDEFDIKSTSGEMPEEVVSLKWMKEKGFKDNIACMREGMIIGDIDASHLLTADQKKNLKVFKSMLLSPLFDQEDNITGSIVLFGKIKNRFDLNHRLMISAISSLTSLALMSARYREEEESLERLNISKRSGNW